MRNFFPAVFDGWHSDADRQLQLARSIIHRRVLQPHSLRAHGNRLWRVTCHCCFLIGPWYPRVLLPERSQDRETINTCSLITQSFGSTMSQPNSPRSPAESTCKLGQLRSTQIPLTIVTFDAFNQRPLERLWWLLFISFDFLASACWVMQRRSQRARLLRTAVQASDSSPRWLWGCAVAAASRFQM